MKTKQSLWVAQTGLLCALAIALSAAEQLFPALPMLPPGAKPGFSNLAAMAAAVTAGPAAAFAIAFGKALFVGLTRGVTAMLMSMAGGVCSTAVMLLLLRANRFGGIGLGVAGAVVHNLAQLCVASALLTAGFVYYLPWLLCFAVVTGTLTGGLFGLIWPFLDEYMIKAQKRK